jgi:hypothetical protein
MNTFLIDLPLVLIGIFLLIAVLVVIASEKRPKEKRKAYKAAHINVAK